MKIILRNSNEAQHNTFTWKCQEFFQLILRKGTDLTEPLTYECDATTTRRFLFLGLSNNYCEQLFTWNTNMQLTVHSKMQWLGAFSSVSYKPFYLVTDNMIASYLKQWALLLHVSARICSTPNKCIVLRLCFPLVGRLVHCHSQLLLMTEVFHLLFARLRRCLLHLSVPDSLTLGSGKSRHHRHALWIVKVI